VNHPEFIPTSQLVGLSSGGFQNIVSDSYWLSTIQYIGSNALGSEYKQYLYVMLNFITDLNPHFTFPYQIGELLLPSYNERYEKLNDTEIQKNTDQAIKIGLKGIEQNCDAKKIEKAKNEYNLKKLWTDESYKNTCRDSMIPYYLAYIYYWNLHDGQKSSEYYRIASTNTDAPTGARTMAAIMQGKSGDREKSIIMLLSLAESIEGNKNTLCQQFSKEL
jgi:predicted nucleic acid binding AN1-type Zn finger protein